MLARAGLILAVLSVTAVSHSIANSWSVLADGTGDFPTIQAAVDAAAPGDTVLVYPGVYTGDGNRDIDPAGKSLVIRSRDDNPLACTIAPGGSEAEPHRGFWLHNGEDSATTIRGFSITGGGGVDQGAGIMIGDPSDPIQSQGGQPRIENCVVISSHAERGGGLAICGESQPVIRDSWFSGNQGSGVAIGVDGEDFIQLTARFEDCAMRYSVGSGLVVGGAWTGDENNVTPVTLVRCNVTGNTESGIQFGQLGGYGSLSVIDCEIAENGGAGVQSVHSEAGLTTLEGCRVLGNGGVGVSLDSSDARLIATEVAHNGGGGVWGTGLWFETLVQDCLIHHNQGVGLDLNSRGYPLVTATTICLNQGDGLRVQLGDDDPLRLVNCLIAYNEGLGIDYVADQYAPPTITCNDIYDNHAGDWTLISEYLGNDGNISACPWFCDPAADDFTIDELSPCAPGHHPDGADCGLIGARDVGCATPLPAPTPTATALLGNAPNPFNPSTTIRFVLAYDEAVSLDIYDLTGRLVRTLLFAAPLPAGPHAAQWRGRDDQGYPVPSGIYLYRLQAGTITETRHMALIK